MSKYVYAFAEGNKDLKDLLGGKGANLAEMAGMGLHLMNYRARMIGASLQIQPGETGGTTVTCLFPIEDPEI